MQLFHFSQIGKRDNNEDALGFTDHAYVVCDGMGGHSNGEVASGFVVDFVKKTFATKVDDLAKLSLEDYLVEAQNQLNETYSAEDYQGMGTTFCGVFQADKKWFLAYIGDSRIYWIKPNQQKFWHTWDHSLVGELMKSGEISREEGRNHPMGNRISKAITVSEPRKIIKPDVFRIDNLEENDLIFICTDGVNEAWKEVDLLKLLMDKSIPTNQKIDKIKAKCQLDSKDNNSAILLEINASDAFNDGSNDEFSWLKISDIQEEPEKHEEPKTIVPHPKPVQTEIKKEAIKPNLIKEDEVKPNDKKLKTLAIVGLVLFVLAAIFWRVQKKDKTKSKQPNRTELQQDLQTQEVLQEESQGEGNNTDVEPKKSRIESKNENIQPKINQPEVKVEEVEKVSQTLDEKNDQNVAPQKQPPSRLPSVKTDNKENDITPPKSNQ